MLTPLLTVSREAIADGSTAVLVDHEHLNMSLNVGRVKGTESVTRGAQLTAMPPLVTGIGVFTHYDERQEEATEVWYEAADAYVDTTE